MLWEKKGLSMTEAD